MRHDNLGLTKHAASRCQQRGIRAGALRAFLAHHDLDREVGGRCRVLRMSRTRARSMAERVGAQAADRLARMAVIVCDETGAVVTAFHDTGRSRRYRAAGGGR